MVFNVPCVIKDFCSFLNRFGSKKTMCFIFSNVFFFVVVFFYCRAAFVVFLLDLTLYFEAPAELRHLSVHHVRSAAVHIRLMF